MIHYLSNKNPWFWLLAGTFFFITGVSHAGEQWLSFQGKEGPGKGKQIVFVTGDEEYRSEESMPQMAKILSVRHGFDCTVLFAIDKNDGTINPYQNDNIPGLHLLKTADLMVIFIRFRDLPPDQMQPILDYIDSGKPIIGIRPAVAAFKFDTYKDQPYAIHDFQYKGNDFYGGFGRQVLGETWIRHYGKHKAESTRGHIAKGQENHPIVRGYEDIWGPMDVYGITTLEGDSKPLVMGQVLTGMNPDDLPHPDKDLVPIAWTKTYTGSKGKAAKVFTSTMGSGDDFRNEGLRRLIVNACYWCLNMAEEIPAKANVDTIGTYDPNPDGFHGHKTGIIPGNHKLPES